MVLWKILNIKFLKMRKIILRTACLAVVFRRMDYMFDMQEMYTSIIFSSI